MDDVIKVLILKDQTVIVTKVKEVAEYEIGQPDCVMIDPVRFDSTKPLPESMSRYPGVVLTQDTQMAILSDNILTMVTPDNKLLSEYLVTISE